jgi:hypothetical protein
MWVYSTGHTETKPPPPVQHLMVNPFAHVGQANVPGAWYEKDADGHYVGKTFHIEFVRGRFDADPAMARYLLDNGFAGAEPWRPPPLPWED